MALLHLVRYRGRRLSERRAFWVLCAVALLGACRGVPPERRPDEVLRTELGLGDHDEVFRVEITGGEAESASPSELDIPSGAWVQFVTTDWRVHEVSFDPDSLSAESRAYMETSGQMASPPLVERDARFVVSFRDAPEGRYPFVIAGNGAPGRGVVVVRRNR